MELSTYFLNLFMRTVMEFTRSDNASKYDVTMY